MVKSLQKILSAHTKKLQKDIALMCAGADEEVIHEFRVGFKKLRALLRLTGKLKMPLSVKELYNYAGKVRELQLLQKQLLLLHATTDLPAYYSLLENRLKQAIVLLNEKAIKQNKNDLILLSDNCPSEITGKAVNFFITKKITALTKILKQPSKTDEQIHSARKLVKDLLYTFHTIEESGLYKEMDTYLKLTEHLHQLGNELGLFQDWCTMLTHLSLNAFRTLPVPEKNILKKTRTQYLKVKREAKSIILSQLHEVNQLLHEKNSG